MNTLFAAIDIRGEHSLLPQGCAWLRCVLQRNSYFK